MIRSFCSSVWVDEASTSNTALIRDAVTFACWPPGPEERDARTTISRNGISTPRPTLIGSSISPGSVRVPAPGPPPACRAGARHLLVGRRPEKLPCRPRRSSSGNAATSNAESTAGSVQRERELEVAAGPASDPVLAGRLQTLAIYLWGTVAFVRPSRKSDRRAADCWPAQSDGGR